jgi:uncharacterized membrane protein YccC
MITLFGVWLLWGAGSAVVALAGALAVLFARGEPYVHRARTVLAFGLLIVGMTTAACLASGSAWVLLATLTALSGLAGWATQTMGTPVPGPALLVIPPTIVSGIPPYGESSLLGHRVAMVAVGAGIALATTMAPWLVLRHGPEQRAVAAAHRATADALAAMGAPQFDAVRSAAWAAVDHAYRTLSLAGQVTRRHGRQRLWTLTDRATHLLHAAEAKAFHDGATAPADLVMSLRQLAARLHGRLPLLRSDTRRSAAEDLSEATRAVMEHAWSGPSHPAPADVLQRVRSAYRITPLSLFTARDSGPAMVIRLMLVTAVSGATAIGLGLEHWVWTPVCAVAVVWGSHAWMTWYRAVQRGLGTVLGCFLGLGLLQLHTGFPVTVLLVATLLFCAELSFPRNYGIAMALITAMLLLLISSASPAAPDGPALAWSRVCTNLIGSAFGVAGVLLLLPTPNTRLLARRVAASLRLQETLLAAGLTERDGLVHRGRIDLVTLDRLASDALGEALGRARAEHLWPMARTVQRLGYLLLACLTTGPSARLEGADAALWQRYLAGAAHALESGEPPRAADLPPESATPCWRDDLVALHGLIATVNQGTGATTKVAS